LIPGPPLVPDYVRHVRLSGVVVGLLLLGLGLGFAFQWEPVTDLWPWSDSRLSYVFIGSILAATAVPVIWIGLSGELRAGVAGALNLAVTFGGVSAFLFQLDGQRNQPDLLPAAWGAAAACVLALGFAFWARRFEVQDRRLTPPHVRASCALFAAVVLVVGLALTLHADVFPWPLRSESSVIFGWIFLGPAVYFAAAALSPYWANATGQLLGFLAYDLVLLPPFLARFDDVTSGDLLSLIVYTAILLYSGGLAIYHLFLDERTRVWGPRRTATSI
jgi:hypothetical protein